jgi:hypothetical protein
MVVDLGYKKYEKYPEPKDENIDSVTLGLPVNLIGVNIEVDAIPSFNMFASSASISESPLKIILSTAVIHIACIAPRMK